MPDPLFADPRLAPLYDHFDDDRSDLDAYVAIVTEFGARTVLDIGCGTGTLPCLLADRGVDVTGVDPAAASLDVARTKAPARHVRWLLGDATSLPPMQVDLAVMTGNVAQVFLTADEWSGTLHGCLAALRPGGRLVFETRDPARRAWAEWDRDRTYKERDVPGVGRVAKWTEVLEFRDPLLTFRQTYAFASTGDAVISDSTLRFRSRDELEESLIGAGLLVDEVRDAPDRPGKEFVYIARRP